MNPTPVIRLFRPSDRGSWNNYVQAHAAGTLFHRIEWQQAVVATYGHKPFYLLAESRFGTARSGSQPGIVGLLPLFEINSLLFGHSLLSVPFAELGGPLTDDPGITQQLLRAAAAIARSRGAGYVEYRNRDPLPGLATKDLYVNFQRELAPDPDDNLKAIPRKSRRMVRLGMKSGLYARTGRSYLDDFYRILAINYHRLGTPIFPKRFFRNFLRTFRSAADVLVVFTPDHIPVAAVLSFFHRDTVMPYYAGSLVEYRNLAPNDFMYWELMRQGCERGCRRFDFGRSKRDTGSYSFKVHWGFEPKPLAYQYQLNGTAEIPNLSPSNPKYRRKIELWRRLPHAVTRLLGPPIARYLA